MMQTVPMALPDAEGRLLFQGSPEDLLPGDLVLNSSYQVSRTTAAEYKREPATLVTLVEPGDYDPESASGVRFLAKEVGQVRLRNDTRLEFRRLVTDGLPVQQEPELFEELVDCDHEEHDGYDQQWRGLCRNVPKGMLVGINFNKPGEPAEMSREIVDSVYPTGVVLFESGRAFQSHPDREWIGFVL